MGLTHDDVDKILHIVDNAPHIDEIEFAHGGLHFRIRRGAVPAASPQNRSAPLAGQSALPGVEQSVPTRAERERGYRDAEIAIRAPVAGIFRRPPPAGHRSRLEAGRTVRADDTIGLVGTASPVTVKAGADGTVKQIFPEDGELVEFDQVLFVIGTDQQECLP